MWWLALALVAPYTHLYVSKASKLMVRIVGCGSYRQIHKIIYEIQQHTVWFNTYQIDTFSFLYQISGPADCSLQRRTTHEIKTSSSFRQNNTNLTINLKSFPFYSLVAIQLDNFLLGTHNNKSINWHYLHLGRCHQFFFYYPRSSLAVVFFLWCGTMRPRF